MLMQKDNIRNPLSQAKLDKFLKHRSTPIDSLRVGQEDGEFLGELEQSVGGVSRSCYQDLRVRIDGIGVLVVYSRSWD